MVLKLENKKEIVNEVAAVAREAVSLVTAEYAGISVGALTDFRKSAREKGVYVRVVRNTLAKRAMEGTAFECIHPALTGPVILAFSKEDPGAAARLLRDLSKKPDNKLVVKGLAIDGQYLTGDQLNVLADLPTYEQAIAQLLSLMQAPISTFVRTLAEPHTKLVRAFAAVRDQKEKQ